MTPDDDASTETDVVAQRFLNEYRQGAHPDIEAYCLQYPELRELRIVLMMAAMLEDACPNSGTNADPQERPPVRERLGDYRLIREAGSGGMGVVYEAIQESLGRRVAVKILPSGVTSVKSLQRFLREARAVASLHHTNIVPVFAVGEDEGIHYYVMPFIDGLGLERVLTELRILARLSRGSSDAGVYPSEIAHAETVVRFDRSASVCKERDSRCAPPTDSVSSTQVSVTQIFAEWEASHPLGTKTQRSNRWSRPHTRIDYWHRVARIGLQVAEALDYADQQGVLHRDIKPSNLLLDHDGIVWVTDFGLAKITCNPDLTPKGEMLGTLRYLAPERLEGIHDKRGDIYSLGLTLYELLTLRIPFETVDNSRLVQQIAQQEPVRPRSIDRWIPVDLETIVLKAIAKDPYHRYPSAASLEEDLRLFLEDRPINARRTGSLERTWRWCRRNPAISSLSACIVIVMIASISVLAVSNSRISRETTAKSVALQAKYLADTQREDAYQASRVSELLANRRFYAAQVNLAGQAFHNGEMTRAEDLLDSVIPRGSGTDFRGFEWNYLLGALHEGLQHTLTHGGMEITALSFAPNARRLLIVGGNRYSGLACVSDVETGELLFELGPLDCTVNGGAYAADGSMFAVALGDGTLRVFAGDGFNELHTEKTGSMLKSLDWSPDAGLLAAGSESGELLLWTTPGFKSARIAEAHQGPILRVFFSRDSTRLYSSADWGGEGKMSRRWNASQFPPELLVSFPGQSLCDESPDGKSLASLDWGTLQITDADTRQVLESKRISTGPLVSAKYDFRGQALLVASRTDRAVRKLNPSTLNLLQVKAQDNAVTALAIGPTGRYWAAGDSKGVVRIWKLDSPQVKSKFSNFQVRDAFFLTDEDVVLGSELPTRLWSSDDGSTKDFIRAKGLREISGDGETLVCVTAVADKPNTDVIEIWRGRPAEPARIKLGSAIFKKCLAISFSGRWLASRTEGEPITIHDLSYSPPKPIHSLDAPCYDFAFSPDERLLVGGEQYGVISCFDVATGAKLQDFAGFDSFWAWGLSIALSTDGKYVAAGNESGMVRVWETESRRLVSSLLAQPGEIRSIVFFPDNRRLVAGGTGDVRIWDFQSEQELLGLPISGGLVEQLDLNESGDRLLAVTPEGAVQVWIGKPASPRSLKNAASDRRN